MLLTRRRLWDGFRGYEKVESEEVQLAAPGLSNRALWQVRCEVCNLVSPLVNRRTLELTRRQFPPSPADLLCTFVFIFTSEDIAWDLAAMAQCLSTRVSYTVLGLMQGSTGASTSHWPGS